MNTPLVLLKISKHGKESNGNLSLRETHSKPFTNADIEAIKKANEAKAAKRARIQQSQEQI